MDINYVFLFLMLFFFLSWVFIAFTIYFIPLIIAFARKHSDSVPIMFLNIFLGWTYVGWLISLLWALNGGVNNNNDC